MGKKTIAEYVESQSCLDAIHALGVDFAQGYFVGMPRPIEQRQDSGKVLVLGRTTPGLSPAPLPAAGGHQARA
jgi:predicted signal transduction protein with EAL and GGDEF domain